MTDSLILLREIEAFLESRRMAESTFGAKAVNDGKLVARLRAGGHVTLETAARVRRYIEAATAAEAEAVRRSA